MTKIYFSGNKRVNLRKYYHIKNASLNTQFLLFLTEINGECFRNANFIERHVEIALKEINQTMRYLVYNYTNASTHRKYCIYAFCNMDFQSSFHASHGTGVQNI